MYTWENMLNQPFFSNQPYFSSFPLLTQSLRFFRRGRASKPKPDLDDEAQSDFEELDSDVENVDELRGWLPTQGCKTLNLLPKESLIRKYLPPGNVMELFEHYKSTQKLLGGHCVGYLSFSTNSLIFYVFCSML